MWIFKMTWCCVSVYDHYTLGHIGSCIMSKSNAGSNETVTATLPTQCWWPPGRAICDSPCLSYLHCSLSWVKGTEKDAYSFFFSHTERRIVISGEGFSGVVCVCVCVCERSLWDVLYTVREKDQRATFCLPFRPHNKAAARWIYFSGNKPTRNLNSMYI